MRLTKKNKNGEYFSIAESKTFDEEQQCINKLGQLEDIEEELCIDLVTLFKAVESVFYKENNEIKLSIVPTIYILERTISPREGLKFRLKDYGKTWALTKEELQ